MRPMFPCHPQLCELRKNPGACMAQALNKLFEEGAIGKLRLKNRFVMAAMGTGYCHHEGYSTPEYVAFMEERAKRGTGLLMTGVTRILSEIGMRPGSMGFYD